MGDVLLRRYYDGVWILDGTNLNVRWRDGRWRLEAFYMPPGTEDGSAEWLARAGLVEAEFRTLRDTRRAIAAAIAVEKPPCGSQEKLTRAEGGYVTGDGRFQVRRGAYPVQFLDRHGAIVPAVRRWEITDREIPTMSECWVTSLEMARVMIRQLRQLDASRQARFRGPHPGR